MNRTLSISVAGFFAFITAVIFVILFMLELLSSTTVLAVSGIVISATILLLMLLAQILCTNSSCRKGLNNALGCFGRPVVFSAVISLGLSLILAAVNPTAITTVNAGIIFAQVFLLVFTVFMLAFLIALSLPTGCVINGNGIGGANNNSNCSCNCSCCCCYDDD